MSCISLTRYDEKVACDFSFKTGNFKDRRHASYQIKRKLIDFILAGWDTAVGLSLSSGYWVFDIQCSHTHPDVVIKELDILLLSNIEQMFPELEEKKKFNLFEGSSLLNMIRQKFDEPDPPLPKPRVSEDKADEVGEAKAVCYEDMSAMEVVETVEEECKADKC